MDTERRATTTRLVVAVAGILIAAGTIAVVTQRGGDDAGDPPTKPAARGIWIDRGELASLPTEGPAWEQLAEYALADWGPVDLGDQNSDHDVHTLAGAMYAVRTNDAAVTDRVRDALDAVTGSAPDEILPVARNLLSYVVAADLIGYRSDDFDRWLSDSLVREGRSRAGIDTLEESALRDPTNHGAHARASVLAVARRLGDDRLVAQIAARFHDWLGRSSHDFEWRERDWQSDPERPRGINPPGAVIEGVDVDGVLPEEQRRSGGFAVPAPRESYVWEGYQGAIATAELLHRAGYEPWQWEDAALRRAIEWLYDVNDFPAEGDDRWIPWLVNARYGTDLPAETPARPGKAIGFTDWTHRR